ncbi:FadR family transcriptional regulator [Streptomyces sp. AV19]|uniref:FadR/GntR family transcriptional regulator n=1 Tax=Streptomyces sp. AV19 TaxID=2793068 RepID=UPI0018FED875|nr:FadR/GntR family transcriptional regulator [Streptomyces sp. AV19]MBH1932888.1 FadR family transcriptional regulator [Streptomyces sp. AV19]MDG4531566.1 FadR family transcriptional regulator [Streptomyces sp. AV19]
MASDLLERIKQIVIDRRLPPGAPLPTERELTELLGTGRTCVREALKALQAMGIVEIRHGFGTYVGPMTMAPITEGLVFRTVAGHRRGEDSLLQLLELREAVETGLAGRLAGRLAEPELAELDAIVTRMEDESLTGPVRTETDRAFHAAFCRGLDNPLIDAVPEAFWSAFHRLRDGAGPPPDPRTVSARHRAIVTAVRAGDAIRTEEAIRDHFCDIRTRLRKAYRFAR